MINELYELSQAMQQCHVGGSAFAQNYHVMSYKECVYVSLLNGQISNISFVTKTQKDNMRNYTETSSGGFPCVKLAPLYFVADKAVIQLINEVKKKPQSLDASKRLILRKHADPANSNWNSTIIRKCENAHRLASKIRSKLADHPCAAFESLWQEFDTMRNPQTLHAELTKAAFIKLDEVRDVALVLDLLFYCDSGKENDADRKGKGEISILFDAKELDKMGMPVTSGRFTEELNAALLASERQETESDTGQTEDAFGHSCLPSDDVMPNVKIGAGFFVKTRTMNKDIPCLHKYKQEGSLTFPVSHSSRLNIQQALNYIAGNDNKGKTWLCIDMMENQPRDILFAYPSRLPDIPISYVEMFVQSEDEEMAFPDKAEKFIQKLQQPKTAETDPKSEQIRIFILRRLNVKNNSGRTKVLYTRQTDAFELEKCSMAWADGCANLPDLPFGDLKTPYPLDAVDILNRFWKQDGKIATDKFKPIPKYHGLELLMEPALSVTADLHRLTESTMNLGANLGYLCARGELSHPIWENMKDMLAMMGLFLYRRHIGKEQYMENLPFLYGQLLKAADELHALYCAVVRDDSYPPQLVGSSLFRSAAEAPVRTMQVLSQRIMPYYAWAKSYRLKNETKSRLVGWLYSRCEKIMVQLQKSWTAQTRFSDEEKAQLFIGYLAKFPESERAKQDAEEVEHAQ